MSAVLSVALAHTLKDLPLPPFNTNTKCIQHNKYGLFKGTVENSFLGKVSEKEMEEIQEKIMSACNLWEYLKKRELV